MTDFSEVRGLRFVRLDLHVHTPASHDFKGDIESGDIVAEALEKKLHGIAITDHNTGAWIDEVKEAAKGTELVIFPGVEITCMAGKPNVHMIALFDPSKDTSYVNALLSKLGLKPDEFGKPDTVVDKTPIEIIDVVSKWGGIAVPAHVDADSGLFSSMRGKPRIKVIQHDGLLAVEAKDYSKVASLLDGNDPDYQRELAVYRASDNRCDGDKEGHCLEGIGSKFTYFKMEKINLDSLYQCFCDPAVRIRQDSEFQEWDYPQIKTVEIFGGFLDGEVVSFHSGLTSILGGKGAGKSLLIELMRFGLGQPPIPPSIRDDHDGKLRKRLENYGRVAITFVDEKGEEFSFTRTYHEGGESIYDVDYSPARMLPVLFLSQNEIIRIAESESRQLEFIDDFFDFRSYQAQIREIEEELVELDKKFADGLRSFPVVAELESSISELETEIERIDKSLSSPIFKEYTQHVQKNQALTAQSQHLHTLVEKVEGLRTQAINMDVPEIPAELRTDPALKRNQDLVDQSMSLTERQLVSLANELSEREEKIAEEQKRWASQLEKVRQKYERHIQESGGDLKSLAADREKKVKQLEGKGERLAQAKRKKESTTSVGEERVELLDNLGKAYQSYSEERQARCKKFQDDSGGKLQVRIQRASNAEEFNDRLLDLKTGSHLRVGEVAKIASSVSPREFIAAIVRYSMDRLDKHLKELARKSDVELSKVVKLAEKLVDDTEYEELLALQYRAFPEDRPEIQFDIGEGNFQRLDEISVGQKSVALLIMALSDGNTPIVIDQPEDSLDIRSIWEDICSKLRSGKEKRQFIFTTHNSSVAVASDTDNFMIIEGGATQGNIVYSGAMDHGPVSDKVLDYLEGGVEPYRMKFSKYRAAERFRKDD